MKNHSLTENFVRELERKILSGEWAIGDRIPTLREMAENMNVSRSVVNAGVVELAKAGYLKIVPRKWTEVADSKKEGTILVMEDMAREDMLTGEALESVLDARRLIECECVQLACTHATPEDMEELRRHIGIEYKATDVKERVKNDLKFHHMLSVMSGNMAYHLILKSFEKIAEKFVTLFYQNGDVFETAVGIHVQIYESLKQKNASKAKEEMEKLLRHGEQQLWKIL